MATLKEDAQAYEPPQTMNIADLEKVSVELQLMDGQGKDKEGHDFAYKYIEIENRQYRVPGTVLGGLKALLKKMPQLKEFSVVKQGEGMATRYQVVPVIDQPVTEEPVIDQPVTEETVK